MEQQIYKGLTTSENPFIKLILAPQLQQRQLPLTFAAAASELPPFTPAYLLTDADIELSLQNAQAVQAYLQNGSVGIALFTSKDYKKKLTFLELGFAHCIELPTATEIVVKTIENALKQKKPRLQQATPSIEYGLPEANFQYLHDGQGHTFLQYGAKAVFMTKIEKSIFDYLHRRKGFSGISELAYAGWKTFDIKPNTIAATIKKLRRKIEDAKLSYTIRNLYGYGYILEKFS